MTCHFLRDHLKGEKLGKLEVISGRYTHQDLNGRELMTDRLYLVEDVQFKGKFLWFTLNDGGGGRVYMLNTLGMSGAWGFLPDRNARIGFDVQGNDNGDDFVERLYFADQRNFGTITITTDLGVLEGKLRRLGVDLLQTTMKTDELERHIAALAARRDSRADKPIKAVLMEQEGSKGIGCGIGNYLSSEILYEARISPHRTLSSLAGPEIGSLAGSIKRIMKLAYQCNHTGYMERFGPYVDQHASGITTGRYPEYHPDVDLKGERFRFKVYDQKTDPNGFTVIRERIGNDRTVHWVREVQTDRSTKNC